ncbi:hypothetical protein [Tropicimonas sediminicola]|uniref:Uncharacterized protein n=1 Tax=Tropicimonas sediminicola TaxID=1031541 RepID=A0A239GP31_9RHOB|nr:hypothetical protein [Tropicimonas sediminicola]SNS70959.1 hypothetical protein SAMN05421757_10347 [Tropicimonas sediminicola]
MQFDVLHALITAALILATFAVAKRMGIIGGENRRFNWKLAGMIFGVVLIFNVIWSFTGSN